VIQLSELTKTFGDRTLFDRVTWQIGDGDRVGLCGPNGAGKTTLLKMLADLEEPDSGIVAKPADLTSAICRRTASRIADARCSGRPAARFNRCST
jgi:ATPase subunit of ABC transporter with duplicated ATPase domains